jgi:hypothetical protein
MAGSMNEYMSQCVRLFDGEVLVYSNSIVGEDCVESEEGTMGAFIDELMTSPTETVLRRLSSPFSDESDNKACNTKKSTDGPLLVDDEDTDFGAVMQEVFVDSPLAFARRISAQFSEPQKEETESQADERKPGTDDEQEEEEEAHDDESTAPYGLNRVVLYPGGPIKDVVHLLRGAVRSEGSQVAIDKKKTDAFLRKRAVQIQAAETPKPVEIIGQRGAGRAQLAPPSAVDPIPAFRPRGNKTRILHVSPRNHSRTNDPTRS